MPVLLTGASGYVGLHVLRALVADGHEVTALVRSPARLGPLASLPGVRVVVADLEDPRALTTALPGHAACVHAALIWPEAEGSELAMRDTAVAARLFDRAGEVGVARTVLISSVAVHRPFAPVMAETDALAPADTYGATKAAGELFLRAACHSSGMTGVVVRPGPVVGPPAFPGGSFRSDGRIAGMVAAARAGRELRVARGEGRQLTDVRELAEVVVRALRVERPEPTYLTVDREPIPWEDVARLAVATTGGRATVGVEGDAGSPPRFSTGRVEALLGRALDARRALAEHVGELAARR